MEDKTLAVLCHIGGLFFGLFAPLLIWGICKSPNRPLLNQHGKSALNFQISMLIYAILMVAGICFLSIGLGFKISMDGGDDAAVMTFALLSVAGALSLGFLALFELVCIIVAVVKVAQEQEYHYPLTIKFIK